MAATLADDGIPPPDHRAARGWRSLGIIEQRIEASRHLPIFGVVSAAPTHHRAGRELICPGYNAVLNIPGRFIGSELQRGKREQEMVSTHVFQSDYQ
jgi:hypothetical protein